MKKIILQFIREDLPSSRFWQKNLQDFVRFVYFVNRGLFQKYAFQRAAGMAYSSIFAMVPTFVVFISVLSSVKIFPVELKTRIELLIFKNFIPETSQKLSEQIQTYIQGFASSATTIGTIGAIFMVVTVFFLLNTIENTFNSIMHAEKSRSVFHKLSAYTFMMVWSPLIIGLSQVIKPEVSIDLTFLNQLSSFYYYALIAGMFALAYKIIPNTYISNRASLVGGIWATILWEIANRSFTNVISKMVNYDKLYGALGTIPMVLIWLYMVWVVVLIGMEITYVSQNRDVLDSGLNPLKTPDALSLQILKHIARTYMNDKAPDSDEKLMKTFHISSIQLKTVFDVLLKNLIIVQLPGNRFTLAKHPKHINVWYIANLFLKTFNISRNENETEVTYIPIQKNFPTEFANLTLEDIT